MAESSEEQSKTTEDITVRKGVTRRRFIKILGGVAGATVASQIPGLEAVTALAGYDQQALSERKEDKNFDPKVTLLDAAPEYPSNQSLLQELLGDKYKSEEELSQEFRPGYKNRWVEVLDKYPQLILAKYIDTYFNHGQDVAQVMEKCWSANNLKFPGVPIKPLQGIFSPENLKPFEDDLGNQGYTLTFDQNKIKELLKDDQNKVVNFSFQVGDVDIYTERKSRKIQEPTGLNKVHEENSLGEPINSDRIYLQELNQTVVLLPHGEARIPAKESGEPLTSISVDEYKELYRRKWQEALSNAEIVEHYPSMAIVGAYDKKKASENLPKLFEVCQSFPDKLFVVAAGNEQEDLRVLSAETAKPNNLLIVGQWNGVFPKNKVYGADIYVNNGQLNLPVGSSFSTPVISAYAAMLFDKGYGLEEVQAKIIEACDEKEYQTIDPDGMDVVNKVKFFNPETASLYYRFDKYPR